MKECYLPMLRTIATAELEKFAGVAVLLLMMLLEKVPENGITVVKKFFQDKVEVHIGVNFFYFWVRMKCVTRIISFYVYSLNF